MMDRAEGVRSRSPRLLVAGIGLAITMLGLVGELASHIASPERTETLLFASPISPWHVLLFVGILTTTVGAAWHAYGLGTGSGRALGTTLGVLSVVLLLAASLAAVRAAGTPEHAATARSSVTDQLEDAATNPAPVKDIGKHHHKHAVANPEGGSEFGHQHAKPGPVTAEERVILNRQLTDARLATRRYRDIEVAKADGYFQVTQFIPGLGSHLANLAIPTFIFDPARPQVLLYKPVGGKMVLAGVAYSSAHVTNTPPEGFAGGSDVWHFHKHLCFTGGLVTVTASKSECPGVFQEETSWLLHAWIWIHNPRGVFTEYNPRVT